MCVVSVLQYGFQRAAHSLIWQFIQVVYTDSLTDQTSGTMLSVLLLLTLVHQGVSQLNNNQKQLLLDLHNWARGNATPTATNMERMVRPASSFCLLVNLITINRAINGAV